MILALRLALWLPRRTGMGTRLVRTRLILTPDRNPAGFRRPIDPVDQRFFSSAAGSVTITTPLLRTRRAVPVGHHVRVR